MPNDAIDPGIHGVYPWLPRKADGTPAVKDVKSRTGDAVVWPPNSAPMPVGEYVHKGHLIRQDIPADVPTWLPEAYRGPTYAGLSTPLLPE